MTTHRLAPATFVPALALLALVPALAAGAPPTFQIQNAAIRVEIDAGTGRVRVVEKTSGHAWEQARPAAPPTQARPAPVYRAAAPGIAAALDLERLFDAGKNTRLTLRLRFTLPDPDAPDLRIEASAPDPRVAMGEMGFLEPFTLDAPEGALVVADYSNGHLYPLDAQPFPKRGFSGDRLDLPWVGLCDLATGRGYALLLETPEDAAIWMEDHPRSDGRTVVAPRAAWRPRMGTWGGTRSIRFHFAPRGGYVALCKWYRARAREEGLIVPFTEKLKRNPNIARLFGAADVWGDASLAFARAAKAAGIEKMLLHGRASSPADMRAINALGYLTSEYDNYTDILHTKDGKLSSNRAILPDDAVLKADGERMTAWLTWDRKTQFMKRCPTLWADAARATAQRVLPEWPFLGRFIDVTTAEALYECHDPRHPMDRTRKRECGPELLRVFRDRGLVMGGEHGIWWCAPVTDYIEGMMSGGFASWPAGHLLHPKTKDEKFEGAHGKLRTRWADYARWGIGHAWRAPLWELVFHDCIVSTWYWGDASDFLLDAAPEITPKKDAYNILYGTIPLLWANRAGAWIKDRAAFLRTCRNTCRLHETIAPAEMLSHEFLTPDRGVQRTRFADGTQCTVNFGTVPWPVTHTGRPCLLPQNGWAVEGPKITQSLTLDNGRVVTHIRTPHYAFSDETGAPVTLAADGAHRLRITVGAPAGCVRVRPGELAPDWTPATALLYRLDADGAPLDTIATRTAPDATLEFGPVDAPASFLFLWGDATRRPDLRIASLTFTPEKPRQGEPLRAHATIANAGRGDAHGVEVRFAIDGKTLHTATTDVRAGAAAPLPAALDTTGADGPRRVTIEIVPPRAAPELSTLNNCAERAIVIAEDWALWPHRKLLRVDAAGAAREQDTPVITPFNLPAGADPRSLRVARLDAQGRPADAVPAQIDAGELCMILPGSLDADATADFAVLWRDATAQPPSLPPSGSFWDPAGPRALTPHYEARFEEGTIASVAPCADGRPAGAPFLSMIIVSSRDTGWGREEDGKVESLVVEHAGPARTIVKVRKALKAGVRYDKRYTFYPRRFDVEIALNQQVGGPWSRAHYPRVGSYFDDKGNSALVDGKGGGEDVAGRNPNPEWYAVCAPDWAHACVALSRFANVTYWDAGTQPGAIGFSGPTPHTQPARISYTIHPGATDAGFARRDHRALTTPVRVTWR